MVTWFCSLLGLTFNSLSEPLQIVVVFASCVLVCFFSDLVVRLIVLPIFRLVGGNK